MGVRLKRDARVDVGVARAVANHVGAVAHDDDAAGQVTRLDRPRQCGVDGANVGMGGSRNRDQKGYECEEDWPVH
ncbi:hypothetical protein MAGR_72390 [Mycolicibacterium agri]|uniref:Uncharacterized protein n=1 Tax=Mycolicibacterium agri TaxID=36811 RepID=A0A7I9WEQ6_MYCAG|nr:hypothetical protein MAGR_72390 [Mycolicibacterium agri]